MPLCPSLLLTRAPYFGTTSPFKTLGAGGDWWVYLVLILKRCCSRLVVDQDGGSSSPSPLPAGPPLLSGTVTPGSHPPPQPCCLPSYLDPDVLERWGGGGGLFPVTPAPSSRLALLRGRDHEGGRVVLTGRGPSPMLRLLGPEPACQGCRGLDSTLGCRALVAQCCSFGPSEANHIRYGFPVSICLLDK